MRLFFCFKLDKKAQQNVSLEALLKHVLNKDKT